MSNQPGSQWRVVPKKVQDPAPEIAVGTEERILILYVLGVISSVAIRLHQVVIENKSLAPASAVGQSSKKKRSWGLREKRISIDKIILPSCHQRNTGRNQAVDSLNIQVLRVHLRRSAEPVPSPLERLPAMTMTDVQSKRSPARPWTGCPTPSASAKAARMIAMPIPLGESIPGNKDRGDQMGEQDTRL